MADTDDTLPKSFTLDDVKGLRNWRPGPASFRVRLALVLAMMVFVVAAVEGLVLGQLTVSATSERIGQSVQADATRIADRLNKTMASRARDLSLLGALDPLRNLGTVQDQQAVLDQLRSLVNDYNWIGLVRDGKVVAASGVRQGGDQTTAPVTENGGVMVLKHPVAGPPGSMGSAIVAELGWDWIRTIEANSLTPDDNGEVTRQFYLISDDNLVMAGPPGTVGTRLSLPAIDRSRVGLPSWDTERWPDGTYLTGAAFAAGEGVYPGPGSQIMNWTVLVRQNESQSFDAASTLRLEVLMVALLLAMVFLPIGWLLAGQVTAPLSQIADYADRLRQGDDVELPRLRAVQEVQVLSASLRALVASLTHKEMELAEMEDRATHDPLTGLFNRAGLQQWLQAATARGRREDSGILLLVGDLDGFKAVNDRLGHGAGDQLLVQVAARLAHQVRATDAVARLGGDEFVVAVMAQRHDGGEAGAIAQRALEHAMSPYDLNGIPAKVGITFGAAMWPDEHRDIAQIMQMADRALYAGKRAGKRRIVFFREMAEFDI